MADSASFAFSAQIFLSVNWAEAKWNSGSGYVEHRLEVATFNRGDISLHD